MPGASPKHPFHSMYIAVAEVRAQVLACRATEIEVPTSNVQRGTPQLSCHQQPGLTGPAAPSRRGGIKGWKRHPMQYYITVSVCVYSMGWLKRQLAAQPSFFLGSVKCRVPRQNPSEAPGGRNTGKGWEGRGACFSCYGPSF